MTVIQQMKNNNSVKNIIQNTIADNYLIKNNIFLATSEKLKSFVVVALCTSTKKLRM